MDTMYQSIHVRRVNVADADQSLGPFVGVEKKTRPDMAADPLGTFEKKTKSRPKIF